MSWGETGVPRFWTGVELKVLRQIYPLHGPDGAASALPGRSRAAIAEQARRLKLRAPRRCARRMANPCFWTPAELALLRQVYPAHGAAGIAAELPGRSYAAIVEQARRLGVKTFARQALLAGLDNFINRGPAASTTGDTHDKAILV